MENYEKISRDRQTWPELIYIVRHGQSAGNVARDEAEAAGLAVIDLKSRDVDIPLSQLGERQAVALGKYLSTQAEQCKPSVVITSSYVRAQQTAAKILEQLHLNKSKVRLVYDERLREREFGAIEGLTRKGIIEAFPREAEMYDRLGKFYYRPPGGESWCDVILRLRSVLDTLAREYSGQRVLIVCHTVVVLCLRYLLEQMSESEILKIDRENAVANCSLTSYRFNPATDGKNHLALEKFNFIAPLEAAGEEITRKDDKAETEIR